MLNLCCGCEFSIDIVKMKVVGKAMSNDKISDSSKYSLSTLCTNLSFKLR